MHDICTIKGLDEASVRGAAADLWTTLYQIPVTLLLHGDVGAGKTTFTKALLHAAGVQNVVTSPTYALLQEYQSADQKRIAHIDCYRLPEQDLSSLIHAAEGFDITIIEWADRLPPHLTHSTPHITVRFEETSHTERNITVQFDDVPLPTATMVEVWRSDVKLPTNVSDHCDVVAKICDALAEHLQKQGRIFRPLLLRRAAEVHDLLRFIDFRDGAGPKGITHDVTTMEHWAKFSAPYAGLSHEDAAFQWLTRQGFEALGTVVRTHGVTTTAERTTLEQVLLYYADKRVMGTDIVTIAERFEDFMRRYGKGPEDSEKRRRWEAEAHTVERALHLADVL